MSETIISHRELWEMSKAEATALRAEVDAMKSEADSAVAVLSDFLEERGESWLARLAGNRAELVAVLFAAAGHRDVDEDWCIECGAFNQGGFHQPRCKVAALLRIADPVFAEVDAENAHAEALREKARREGPVGVLDGLLVSGEEWERIDYHRRSRVMTSGVATVRSPGVMVSDFDPASFRRWAIGHETGGTSIPPRRFVGVDLGASDSTGIALADAQTGEVVGVAVVPEPKR